MVRILWGRANEVEDNILPRLVRYWKESDFNSVAQTQLLQNVKGVATEMEISARAGTLEEFWHRQFKEEDVLSVKSRG